MLTNEQFKRSEKYLINRILHLQKECSKCEDNDASKVFQYALQAAAVSEIILYLREMQSEPKNDK